MNTHENHSHNNYITSLVVTSIPLVIFFIQILPTIFNIASIVVSILMLGKFAFDILNSQKTCFLCKNKMFSYTHHFYGDICTHCHTCINLSNKDEYTNMRKNKQWKKKTNVI